MMRAAALALLLATAACAQGGGGGGRLPGPEVALGGKGMAAEPTRPVQPPTSRDAPSPGGFAYAPPAMPQAMGLARVRPLEAVRALPRELGLGLVKQDDRITDFEARPGAAGHGAGVRYAAPSGPLHFATIYVYDRGRVRLPDGPGGPELRQELVLSMIDVQGALASGLYRGMRSLERFTVRLGGRGGSETVGECARFELEHRDGSTTRDVLCVTVRDGAFLKVRISAAEMETAVLVVEATTILMVLRPPEAQPLPPGTRML